MNCCTDCDFKSQISTNVINHIESKHVTSLGYTCPLCSKFCSSKNAWHLHKSRYHKGMWLQGLKTCFGQRSLRMQTGWTAALTVISSLKLPPMSGTMWRHITWVLVESITLAIIVEKHSNPRIPFKAISRGQREGVAFITIVSIPKSWLYSDDQWPLAFISNKWPKKGVKSALC